MERNNHFLDYLTDPCFQGVNRLFFLFYPMKIVHIEQGTENKKLKFYLQLTKHILSVN